MMIFKMIAEIVVVFVEMIPLQLSLYILVAVARFVIKEKKNLH